MSAQNILNKAAKELGWNEETMLKICCDYIDQLNYGTTATEYLEYDEWDESFVHYLDRVIDGMQK